MKNRLDKILLGTLVLAMVGGFFYFSQPEEEIAIGVPNNSSVRNLLPRANQTYDLGTTSPAFEWNNIFTRNLTVSGTLSGSGFAESIFTLQTNGDITATTTASGYGLSIDYITATSTSQASSFAIASSTLFSVFDTLYV